jgi:hypothetical protein
VPIDGLIRRAEAENRFQILGGEDVPEMAQTLEKLLELDDVAWLLIIGWDRSHLAAAQRLVALGKAEILLQPQLDNAHALLLKRRSQALPAPPE